MTSAGIPADVSNTSVLLIRRTDSSVSKSIATLQGSHIPLLSFKPVRIDCTMTSAGIRRDVLNTSMTSAGIRRTDLNVPMYRCRNSRIRLDCIHPNTHMMDLIVYIILAHHLQLIISQCSYLQSLQTSYQQLLYPVSNLYSKLRRYPLCQLDGYLSMNPYT